MDVTLDDLEVIATLGVGGFGRVELVKVIMMMMLDDDDGHYEYFDDTYDYLIIW